LWIKRPGREADHSPPPNAEVKECVELYLHSPNTPPWRGAELKKGTGTTLPLLYVVHKETKQIQKFIVNAIAPRRNVGVKAEVTA